MAHDYHDLESMPGGVAACYEGDVKGLVSLSSGESMVQSVQRKMSVMPLRRLFSIPRLSYTSLQKRGKALTLFRVSATDQAKMVRYDSILRSSPKAKGLESAPSITAGFSIPQVVANRTSSG